MLVGMRAASKSAPSMCMICGSFMILGIDIRRGRSYLDDIFNVNHVMSIVDTYLDVNSE